MRKLLTVLMILLLVLVMGYAAGGASAEAAGVAPKHGGAGDAWVYALVLLAAVPVGTFAWRRLRRPDETKEEG